MGGYHQVPSTTHLDSLLVCKARGMALRQVVLLRPCMMLHQRHPAPMQPLRYILPGWELTEDKCAQKTAEARRFVANSRNATKDGGGEMVQGDGDSFDPQWGFPTTQFAETLVEQADEADWQWFPQVSAIP